MSQPLRRIDSSGHPVGTQPVYSTVIPFVIVLLTLILSTCKDILVLYRHKVELLVQDAQARQPLDAAAKQAVFIDSIHNDLGKLAPTDPVAAKVLADFFGPPAVRKDTGGNGAK